MDHHYDCVRPFLNQYLGSPEHQWHQHVPTYLQIRLMNNICKSWAMIQIAGNEDLVAAIAASIEDQEQAVIQPNTSALW